MRIKGHYIHLPTGASPSPAKDSRSNKLQEKLNLVQDYYCNDGELCDDCSCFIQDPDVNFYSCKVLAGVLSPDYAECL